MNKRILHTQLNYIVNKSNFDRAQKELLRLKRTPGVPDEEIERAQARVDILREKNRISLQEINAAGVSKNSIG